MIDHPAQRHSSPNLRTGLNFVAVAGTLQRTVKVPLTGKVLLYLYVHDGQAQTVVKAIVHDRMYQALPGRDQLEGAFLSVQGRIETVSRNQGQSTLQIVAQDRGAHWIATSGCGVELETVERTWRKSEPA